MTIAAHMRARPMQVLSVLLLLNGVAVGLMMQKSAEAGISVPLIGAGALLVTLAALISLARLVRDPLERLEAAVRSLNAEVARGGEPVSGLGLKLAYSGDLTASTRSLLRVRQVLADRHRKAEEDQAQRRNVEDILAAELLQHDGEMDVLRTAAGELSDGLRRLANGEIGLTLELAMPDELEPIRVNFNRASSMLAREMGVNDGGHAAIVRETGIVLAGSTDLAEQGARQASGIVELRRSARKLGQGAQARATEAQELAVLAARTRGDLQQSVELIAAAQASFDTILSASSEMEATAASVQETLRDTSLASLNAGIAAVQAGESETGLAAVLIQVRALAEQSAQAAGSLSGITTRNGPRTAAAVAAIDRASREIEAIGHYIEAIEERAATLAQAEREDVAIVGEAERLARDLEGGARDHANTVEKTVTAMSALSRSLGRVELRLGPSHASGQQPQDIVRPAAGRPYLRRVK